MSVKIHFLKPIVAATLITVTFSLPTWAENEAEGALPADMLGALRQAEPAEAKRLADELAVRWEASGSPAMDLLVKRAKDAVARGDMDQALEHLTALTDHAPDFAEGWHLRANAFFQNQQLGLALHDLERTLSLNPNQFQALFGLGTIMEHLGKPDLAADAYRLALAIYPHYEDAKNAIARIEAQAGGRDL